ncbi:MAG: PQQ-binding-like beta-propeller repeat protein [Planctomycetota bacterium]|nr:PQQ-binding-like beta-propeller repeat protein [Planctomycetota bacterium]
MRIFVAAFFGLSILWLGDSSQAQSRLSPQLPAKRTLDRYGLVRSWWNQAALDPTRDKIHAVTIDEEVFFAVSTGGMVTAFDAENGRRLWVHALAKHDEPASGVTANDELALVAVGLHLFAIDKFTGEMVWQVELPDQPSTAPVMDDHQVYVGTVDGSVYAFNLKRIKELFDKRLLPRWSLLTQVWRFNTSKPVVNKPLVNGRVVLFASLDKSAYAVTARDRDLVFQFEADSPISAPLASSQYGYVFMATGEPDFKLYCMNMNNGELLWTPFNVGLPITKAPRAIGDHLFVTPVRGGMYNLHVPTGDQLWWKPRITQFLAASSKVVYASDQVGNVVLLDRANGATLGSLDLRRFSVRISNERTDRLYVTTPRGRILCLREKANEFPNYYLNPERRPLMPEFASDEPAKEPDPKQN